MISAITWRRVQKPEPAQLADNDEVGPMHGAMFNDNYFFQAYCLTRKSYPKRMITSSKILLTHQKCYQVLLGAIDRAP